MKIGEDCLIYPESPNEWLERYSFLFMNPKNYETAIHELEKSNGIFGVDCLVTVKLTLSRIADQSQQIKDLEVRLNTLTNQDSTLSAKDEIK